MEVEGGGEGFVKQLQVGDPLFCIPGGPEVISQKELDICQESCSCKCCALCMGC